MSVHERGLWCFQEILELGFRPTLNATAPTSNIQNGELYYDTTDRDKSLYIYNGSAWVNVVGVEYIQDTANAYLTAGVNLTKTYNDSSNTLTLDGKSDSAIRGLFSGGTGVTYTAGTGAIAIGQAVETTSNVRFNDVQVDGNQIITGNLTVNGTQTILNTETLTVDDNLIVLNNNEAGTPSENAGIEVERGTSTNVQLRWNESTDHWEITNDGSAYTKIAQDTGELAEGTNLYYTDARARAAISEASTNLAYNSTTGVLTYTQGNTDTVSEGSSNLYYTNARADARVNLQTGTNLDLSGVSTSTLPEGTNLYYTNSRVDTRMVTQLLDEDNMASNSSTKAPTQQSVKAYVDTQIATVNTGNTLAFTDDATTGSLAIDFDTETLTIAGGTGLTTAGSGNTLTVSLDNTAVTAASYGGSTAIPVITIDAQGRITAASTASISTSWTLTGDSGSQTVAGGDTVDIAGGTNITTVAGATDTLTVNMDTTLSGMVAGTFSGAVQGGSLTDGTATLTGGALSGVTTIGATNLVLAGDLTVNGTTTTVSSTNTTISDKLLELGTGSTGSASGDAGIVIERGDDANAFFGWDESADQFQFATTTATGSSTGDLTLTDANLKAGTVTYASLSDGAITITAFVDEDNMASNSATLVPTQQSVKAYVDSQVVAQDDGIIRATATADSSTTVFTIGTIPSVSGRSYFANKAVIKVTTAFSGGSVDGFKITDDESSEATYVTAVQADPTVTGTYVLDLGMEALVSGTTLQLDVVQSDGSTAATATAGAATVTVEYVYNT